MDKLYFKQLDNVIAVNISKEYAELILESKFYLNYIPNIEIVTMRVNFDYEIYFLNKNKFLFKNNFTQKLLKVYALMDMIVPSHEAVVVIIDYIFEYLNALKGRYTVHGSSFNYKGNGVLVLGQTSGIGKTTLALNMCLNGAKFIGDDKILINSSSILGGAKAIRYNKLELKKSIPIDLTIPNNQNMLNFQKLDESVKLSHIIFPIITISKGLYVRQVEEKDLDFTLFEEMSRKIRGISKRIAGNYALPSLDTVKTAKLRSINAGIISKKVKGLYIIGDVKSIMNYIESNFSVIE